MCGGSEGLFLFFLSRDRRPIARTFLTLPSEKRRMFALSRLAFATVIIASERRKNASICGRAAKESRRSYWLDGLSPGACNVFIKASKRTVFKRVYGRVALPFLLFFFLLLFVLGGFFGS